MSIEDLEPDNQEEDREFIVTRSTAGSTGYSPTSPGGVTLSPTGPGLSGGAIDVAFQNFIATGVVPSDAVLGYESGARGPLTVQQLYEAGMRDISVDDLYMIATKGPGILDRELALRVELSTGNRPIRRGELVNQLPERNLEYLAMDMFLNVDGAYRDIDEVFDDDGMVNMQQFNYALEQTFKQAMIAGPSGFGTTSEFLDILTQNRDLDVDELQALFDEREAEIRAEEAPSIVPYDPVGLAAVAKDAFANATGRRGTKAEQQEFVRLVHGLQRSGQRSIDVGAQAQEFAREAAPVEASAMDEATAGSILMDVIRSRR